MTQGKTPKPYVNDVKEDDSLMEYTSFPTMGIGARKSGQPSSASTGPKRLEHVGGSESGPGKKDKR